MQDQCTDAEVAHGHLQGSSSSREALWEQSLGDSGMCWLCCSAQWVLPAEGRENISVLSDFPAPVMKQMVGG